jgi:hypothetical protein
MYAGTHRHLVPKFAGVGVGVKIVVQRQRLELYTAFRHQIQ